MSKKAEFKLKIELGNAAMLTPEDVALALARVADKLIWGVTSGRVNDNNGNSVGEFSGVFPAGGGD